MLWHKAFRYLCFVDDYEKLVSDLLQGNKGYHPVDGFGFLWVSLVKFFGWSGLSACPMASLVLSRRIVATNSPQGTVKVWKW